VSGLVTLCRIEAIKLRGTLALAMVFVAPLLVVALQMLMWASGRGVPRDTGVDLWWSFAINVLSIWAVFMQPLFVALVVMLVYHADHASQGWLRMFLLPVPRWSVPASKLAVVLVLVTAANLVLFAGSVGGAAVMDAARADITLPARVPFDRLALAWGKVLLASSLVVAIQNLVSLRWSSATFPLGVGVAGTMGAVFAATWKHGHWHPWLMPIQVLHKPAVADQILWVSPVLATLLIVATLVYASRRAPGRWA
jgi:hypothetical protein